MNLDHYIADLLKDHDCVVVPTFGGFVANYAPARINPVNHRFDPPHRKVTFNKLLTHNDGLLASYVARREEEQYEAGLKRVQDYALFLRSELKTKKKVKLRKVGVLSQNTDGSIRFEQVENADLYSDGTGLESFFAHKIDSPVEEETTAEEPKEEIIKPVQLEPKVRTIAPVVEPVEEPQLIEETEQADSPRPFPYLRVVAAAVAVPLIGYAVWLSAFTPMLKDRSNFHASDLNPFSNKVCEVYQPRVESLPEMVGTYASAISEDDTKAFLSITKTSEPDKTLVVNKSKKQKKTAPAILKYHVMGGCFGMKSNADGLVSKYLRQGNHASIIDQKGSLYRVSIASFATKKEAEQALASLQNDIPGAWLLYK